MTSRKLKYGDKKRVTKLLKAKIKSFMSNKSRLSFLKLLINLTAIMMDSSISMKPYNLLNTAINRTMRKILKKASCSSEMQREGWWKRWTNKMREESTLSNSTNSTKTNDLSLYFHIFSSFFSAISIRLLSPFIPFSYKVVMLEVLSLTQKGQESPFAQCFCYISTLHPLENLLVWVSQGSLKTELRSISWRMGKTFLINTQTMKQSARKKKEVEVNIK